MKRFVLCCLALPVPVVAPGCRDPFVAQVELVRQGKSDFIHVPGRPTVDGDLAALQNLAGLRELLLDDASRVTDRGLQQLTDLRRLEHLRIRGAPIGDGGMQHLAGLSRLRILNLPDARFSDAGLASLRRLTRLELLRFHSPNVSDAGMACLAEMPSLRFLHLIDVPITDQGLAHLESLAGLESLYLDGVPVTDDGVERLLKALPEVHLHFNQGHHDRDPRRTNHAH